MAGKTYLDNSIPITRVWRKQIFSVGHVRSVQNPGDIPVSRHHRRIDPGLVWRDPTSRVILSQTPNDPCRVLEVLRRKLVLGLEFSHCGRRDVEQCVAGRLVDCAWISSRTKDRAVGPVANRGFGKVFACSSHKSSDSSVQTQTEQASSMRTVTSLIIEEHHDKSNIHVTS